MAEIADTEIVKVQMPIAMADAVRKLAEQHERSFAAEVRVALRAHLASESEQAA